MIHQIKSIKSISVMETASLLAVSSKWRSTEPDVTKVLPKSVSKD